MRGICRYWRVSNPVKDWIEAFVGWHAADSSVARHDRRRGQRAERDADAEVARGVRGCLSPRAQLKGVLIFVAGRPGVAEKSLAPNKIGCWRAHGNPSDKDSVKHCVSHWIVELGELGSTFKKADIDQLKAFLTKSKDERPAFTATFSRYQRRKHSMAQ